MNRPRKPARPALIRAIAYTRVSTEDQAESGAGLLSQEQALIAEIERRGWQLVKVVDDPAEHGSTPPDKRPGFAEALVMLAAGEADAVVAKKVDRVCRSVRDFYNLDARSQREGWQLVTLDSDPSTPEGRAMRGMLAVFAELERDFISQRTKDALAVKRQDPDFQIGRKHTVSAATRNTVRELRSSGLSWRKVADQLTNQAIPGGQGGNWHPMTCKRIAEDTSERV